MQANWIGYKFDKNLPDYYSTSKNIKRLRNLFKEEFSPSKYWKFSFKKDRYSAIFITIYRVPTGAFDSEVVTNKITNSEPLSFYDFYENVQEKLNKEANAFNYDNSNGMEDYFDRNYYVHWIISPNIEIVKVEK